MKGACTAAAGDTKTDEVEGTVREKAQARRRWGASEKKDARNEVDGGHFWHPASTQSERP